MKIKGQTIKGPNVETIVIPRGDNDSIVMKARAVVDYEPFKAMVPMPEPPRVMRRGETVSTQNFDDDDYKTAINNWFRLRSHWLILQSLSATDGLEWETIKLADPTTWDKISDEFKTAGFSQAEQNLILSAVQKANGLDEDAIKEARDRFLSGQATVVSA